MAVPHHVHTMGASHSQRHNCIARHCMAFHSRSFVMRFTEYFVMGFTVYFVMGFTVYFVMAFHSRSFVMRFTVYFQPDADTGLAGGGHVESEGRGGLTMMALEVTYRRDNMVLHMFFRLYVHLFICLSGSYFPCWIQKLVGVEIFT